MSQEMALQQERACATFDCAEFSSSLTSAGKQPKRRTFFQRCVLLLLLESLLLDPARAAPTAVVEPAIAPTHFLATTVGLSVGNPILPATAEKFQSETDFTDSGPAPLSFGRFYRSTWAADTSRPVGVLGAGWTHTYSASLRATPAVNPVAVMITSAEGYMRTFTLPAGASSWSATNSADSLTWTPAAWIYRRADDDSTSRFDATTGKLLSRTARNGWTTRYTYNAAGQLITVTNPFGRTLRLTYNGVGLLGTVTTPDGRSISYAYDASGRLWQVGNPDGKTRSYLYENFAFPRALTGLVDEAGVRLSTYAYDAQGRAVSTERAGGVDRYQVSYPAAGTATITDPLSISRTYTYSTTLGKLAVTGGSLPSATGQADAAARVQDANGLIASETDFKGVTSSTTWDAARRLPISVARAVGTPAAQTVTTQWHSTFSLPVLVTESGRTTAWTYDERGNALSRTLTDTASGEVRRWQWSYTAQSQVAAETAPNGAVTTYTYDPVGNMTQSVNALGHVTRYGYDPANRVISETTPNGLITTYTWDLRDRLLTKTVGGHPATALIDAEKLGVAFMYDEDGTLLAETGMGGANSAGSTQHIYLPTAGGPMPIAAVINGQMHAVHSDHLNTPRRLTDSQGQAVWQWSYSAFGDEKPTIAKYRFANLELNLNPGTTNGSAIEFNKRLDGQYYDKESGLHFNWNRSYDPRMGRFPQADPAGLAGGPKEGLQNAHRDCH